jgi:hydroxypyruvate isomerase
VPRFAANLSMLFQEVEFPQRFARAAAAGFGAVECQFPYDHPAALLAQQLRTHGLALVLHNLPAGDWAAGERGIACHPERIAEFRAGVELGIEYARTLGCRQLNCLAGITPPDADPIRVAQTLVGNLRHAAARLAAAGLRLLVEPINTYDMPGFHLHGTKQALALIEQVGADNLRLQYDVYHMQRMEGELAGALQRLLPRIGHIQIADNPGRGEPGSGEINFPFLFDWIDRLGYDGWIGCEYRPRAATEAGLAWLRPWLSPAPRNETPPI